MRLLLVLLLPIALLSGCGDEERERSPQPGLPAALAAEFAMTAEQIAQLLEAADGCGARNEAAALQRRAIAAVNAGRVPQRYQEQLLGSINALAATIACGSEQARTDEPVQRARDLAERLRQGFG